MISTEKRALDAKDTTRKRSRSQVLAALPKELLDEIPSGFEDVIRRAVAEEVERAFSKYATQGRPIDEMPMRKFHLLFKTNPAAKIFTENNLEDEHGDIICVMLIDTASGQPVTSGPESVAKLEVVPLMGDFNTSEDQEWTSGEFERHVAKEREMKGPLLVGDLKVHLQNGVGTMGKMYFTDNSSFTRSKKFRLGIRVAQDNEYGLMSIREGKSQAFTVLDNRGKAYKKHDIPSPTDEVWRLKNIGRNGPYHTRLEQIGIKTVQDFLFYLETRKELLQSVLVKMSEKAFQDTIDHAKKCRIAGKIYIYPMKQDPYESLIFDSKYQARSVFMQGHYVGLEKLDDTEKVHIDGFIKSAYNHWYTDVQEVDVELTGPSITAHPDAIDNSIADAMVDVAAALPEAVPADGSSGAESVPDLGPITEKADVDPNVTAERFEIGWTENEQLYGAMQALYADEAENMENIANQVQHVINEENEDPFYLFSIQNPSPPVGRWWLSIRAAVRCALFIRRAGLAQRQLPSASNMLLLPEN